MSDTFVRFRTMVQYRKDEGGYEAIDEFKNRIEKVVRA